MKRTHMVLAVTVSLLGGVGQLFASAVQLTSPSQLNPTDTTLNYPEPSQSTPVPSPFSLSAGGTTLTFTTATGLPFIRLDQDGPPPNFGGAFPDNATLLVTLEPNGPPAGPVDIRFAPGVGEFGFQVQDAIGPPPPTHTYTATVFDGSTQILTFTTTSDDFLGFIGARAINGETITDVHVSSDTNAFAIGPVTFGSPAAVVPEPSTLVMAGTAALVGLGYTWRRRHKAAATS